MTSAAAWTSTGKAARDATCRAAEGRLLSLRGVTKQFSGVTALDNVDFDLVAGEVHVLFGENGAGKSTLISLVTGAERPTRGTIELDGKPIELPGVNEGRARGISAVFQEFSLVPQLTVEENIFLGAECAQAGLLDKKSMREKAQAILDRLDFDLKPSDRVEYLSRAEQQMVEIARAFRTQPRILILDEPTASLTDREANRLFTFIEEARRNGVGVIYITHRMGEIRRIADRITVLRDGVKIATVPAGVDEDTLVQLMTGRVIEDLFPRVAFRPGRQRLEIHNLTTESGTVRDVSLELRSGEVVGIAGLVGSGKSEVGRACFGLERLSGGRIVLDGDDITGLSIRKRLQRGLYYLPPDRRREGLVMVEGARGNISLTALDHPDYSRGGLLRRAHEAALTRNLAQRVELRPMNLERQMQFFSGGNQQKVMIAKALSREGSVLIFDEPTVGVDVGTRAAIYGFIKELCEAGAAMLLISSDLPEIIHLTNRAYVMYRGRMQAELSAHEITEEAILGHFFEKDSIS
jgi:ribose transport system ATP-binding protein